MTDIEAADLARFIGGAWSARPNVVSAYAIALKALDPKDAREAVESLIGEVDRLPSVKRIMDAYYGVRREKRETSEREYPPCCECQMQGGWKLPGSETKYPPREEMPPYTDAQGWQYGPMCSAHGMEYTRRSWNGNKPKIAEVLAEKLDEGARMAEVDANLDRIKL